MTLPQRFIDSITACPGFDEPAFIQAHQQPATTSIRLNPLKSGFPEPLFADSKLADVPWCKYAIVLNERPKFTLDPLLHAGVYYVQEASSMFLYHLIETILPNETGLKALDLCAAPGGKTTLLASMKQFDAVLANEIISSRVPVLYENLVKWGSSKTFISNNDPKDFAPLGTLFDVVLVDAPCSGSGLFRKDPDAITEWSDDLVHFCSLRQQRIIQDAIQVLKPGGFLVYSTCSYSLEENEQMLDFIMEQRNVSSIDLGISSEWNVVHSVSEKSAANGYRFYPDKVMGEGFFCSVFKKNETSDHSSPLFFESTNTIIKQVDITGWVDARDVACIEENGEIVGVNKDLLSFRALLKQHLKLRKSGVKMGAVMKKGFVPDHELALSEWRSPQVNRIELNKGDALKYLRKDDVLVDGFKDGVYLMAYQKCGLGWGKVVNNRLKNNYPMNWRILMRDA